MSPVGTTNTKLWARCFLGVLCVLLIHTFTNRYVNPLFPALGASTIERAVASLGPILFFLVLLLVAYNRPDLIKTRPTTVLSAVMYALGVGCMYFSFRAANPLGLTVGVFVAGAGAAWVRVLALVALIRLDERACLVCVSAAMITFYVLKALVYALPDALGTVICALLVLIALAATYSVAAETIEQTRPTMAPALLALTEPRKFIPLAHTFFITLVTFNVACGFSVSFNAIDGVPYSSLWAMAPVVVVALWFLLSGKSHSDTVYIVACLFIVAGLLLVLVPGTSRSELPNTLLAAGINIFKMVLIVSLAAIARHNPSNALPVFAWGEFATSLGIWAGDLIGSGVETLWTTDVHLASLLISALILGFVGYNLFTLRAFGFESTTGSIEAYAEVLPPEEARNDDLTATCAVIAEDFALTERERDVFGLLARGRNVPFIEEELIISRNTIKTHIRHIYQKLNLHSQQELIDFAETYR